ncbi:hypothetical protein K2173_021149 [Erythroxylum novogranatense]|uniref:Carboxypeptidase n=1 Tax=Erythroxylum novogranatense TaxID=1862640 RepID=A0AAV8TQM6_9ROSI|nr:hypothetical protein K2173_021149 [Erythroxylum novogranatense]
MEKIHYLFVLCLFFSVSLFHRANAMSSGSKDGSEEWGYVQVRPKFDCLNLTAIGTYFCLGRVVLAEAHMFWWLYRSPNRVHHSFKPWPTILWLQGGPGSSGVGIGNFEEIGPLDSNLKHRNSTWLQVADLLFVDNPVGTGYSFVEGNDLYVKTDEEAATDLTTFLKKLFNRNKSLQESPLYIVAESYGGKYAVTLALSALKAIEARKLKLKLGGVAIGNSWISSEDFVLSWGPLLKDVSRLDNNGLDKSNSIAQKIKQQIRDGLYANATQTWAELQLAITANSNNVDFYNFLLDEVMNAAASTSEESSPRTAMRKYSTYLRSLSGDVNGDPLMDGIIRQKLKIIPDNVIWGQQSSDVFDALSRDFMKPRINEVDELLAKGVNVTVYNGQLDVICSAKGTEAWVEKLEWEGLQNFMNTKRRPLYCGEDGGVTKGFTKSYKNLQFNWILGAGHFVPVDEPCISLQMIGDITNSPAITSHH